MSLVLSAFAAGLLFGLGLVVSQMVNPGKVLAFLDIFGDWDPSLAWVMGGALAVSALGHLAATARARAVLGPRLEVPARRDVDLRLVGGAGLFGIGWGLVGLCPGPALAVLSFSPRDGLVFLASMIAGMALFEWVPKTWPDRTTQAGAAALDG
jgi:uncharacterized protein